ncbi:uncharacterized protein LOC115622452 [Scaptodrosophila lebanonensis]|uniref:Uncharacterized protein LOC115622452 n=1 Tax=Drosophila lebanonensis TaxID=7225 RepID=A0A6J2TA86_DROLE|nr:uncharacterized protein LOC115622452 [Scaptodrosophila lebanonensis]
MEDCEIIGLMWEFIAEMLFGSGDVEYVSDDE